MMQAGLNKKNAIEYELFTQAELITKHNDMLIRGDADKINDLRLSGVYDNATAAHMIKEYERAYKLIREKEIEFIRIRVNNEQTYIPVSCYTEWIEKQMKAKKILEEQAHKLDQELLKVKEKKEKAI